MEKSEEEIEKEFANEIESILNRKPKDATEFEIIDTEKFRELCEIILGLDFKLEYRKKFSKTSELK